MRVNIRKAEPEDAEQLIIHIKNLANEDGFEFPLAPVEFNFSTEEEAEKLEEFSDCDNSLFLVAEIGKTIIGYLECKGGRSIINQHSVTFIISIEKDYRNQGIGTSLMQEAVNWAKNTGKIKRIQLSVYTENKPAIRLYEKFGFQIEGTHKMSGFHSGKYINEICMALFI